MVKRIIILALCLMLTVPPSAGDTYADQFGRLVQCYRQMFENGLLEAVMYERIVTDPTQFDSLLNNFYYSQLGIESENQIPKNGDGNKVPLPNNEHFRNAVSFKNLKDEFSNQFVYLTKYSYESEIPKLMGPNKANLPNVKYPLNKFLPNYNYNDTTGYLKDGIVFCNKYSENPNVIANLR